MSQDILNVATRKNRKKTEQGKVKFLLADVHQLPFENSTIDKAYTVNTVYFWQDVGQVFFEIKRILKPGGIFLNVLYLKEWLDRLPVTRHGYSKYTAEQIEKATLESGLNIERIIEIEARKSICVIAKKYI
jgi:ubiquinone/menaquinone biosynthesis C-methylase UbiE